MIKKVEDAVTLISSERYSQIEKGFNSKHDDLHSNGELAEVAEQILHASLNPHHSLRFLHTFKDIDSEENCWHWKIINKHKNDKIKMLTIAGALIAAEIERLQRLEK